MTTREARPVSQNPAYLVSPGTCRAWSPHGSPSPAREATARRRTNRETAPGLTSVRRSVRRRLWEDFHPRRRTGLDVGIVGLRIGAVVPVIVALRVALRVIALRIRV